MNHLVKTNAAKQLLDLAAICDVAVDELKRLLQRCNAVEITPLALRIVKAIEIIQRPNRVSGKNKRSHKCEPMNPAPPVTRKFTAAR